MLLNLCARQSIRFKNAADDADAVFPVRFPIEFLHSTIPDEWLTLPLLEVIRSLCQQQRIVPGILNIVLYGIKLKNVAV